MRAERIVFFDSAGNKVVGILSDPTEDKSKPTIILCHGFQSSKESTTNLELEVRLHQKEISTFRFDFYGHGESEGKFADITVSKAVDNLFQAINHLQKKGYRKIGLVGSSFGGLVSLVAASKSKGLFVLALKCPVSERLGELVAEDTHQDIEEWKRKGFIERTNQQGETEKLNYSFYKDAKRYADSKDYKNIKIPTLIIHGDKDITVPLEQSIKTAKIVPHCRLEIIKGADHSFKTDPQHFQKMISLISEFIISHAE
ncbi:MAG: alpha/beta hydrolase [Candidatus Woesearchaeota archaeon]